MCTAVPPTKIDPNYLHGSAVDVEALFLSKPVRSLLKRLTGFELDRIFAKKRKEYTVPTYKLLTDAQLKEEYDRAMRKAEFSLSMPPVMRKRLPCEVILKKEPAMQGVEQSNFVITDISFGIKDRNRLIVVRQPDGTLRTAGWEERERMIQTYLTDPAREFFIPKMFIEPHLTQVLNRGWYIFALDRACVQFEPDDEYFIGVTHRVYDHIREKQAFDVLRSTRHFGPMSLYFAVTKKGDELVLFFLTTNRLEEAADFVKLLHIVHPDSRSAELVTEESSPMEIVGAYIKLEAQMKSQLDLALQSFHDVAIEATA